MMKHIEDQIKLLNQLIKKKDFAEARILVEKLVFIHSAHAELNFLAGLIYDRLNLTNRAEEFYHNALNLAPNYYDALFELSLFYEKQGENGQASIYRERAYRIATRMGEINDEF